MAKIPCPVCGSTDIGEKYCNYNVDPICEYCKNCGVYLDPNRNNIRTIDDESDCIVSYTGVFTKIGLN